MILLIEVAGLSLFIIGVVLALGWWDRRIAKQLQIQDEFEELFGFALPETAAGRRAIEARVMSDVAQAAGITDGLLAAAFRSAAGGDYTGCGVGIMFAALTRETVEGKYAKMWHAALRAGFSRDWLLQIHQDHLAATTSAQPA